MEDVITIGVDLAKSVFQVHGVDAAGSVVVRRQLRRRRVLPFFERLRPCVVGMEACATAHHWGREIERLGHRVRLMPPRYVKAYVKIQKNDAADAEAICEAVTRPTMRFVELKTSEQQSILVLHRAIPLMWGNWLANTLLFVRPDFFSSQGSCRAPCVVPPSPPRFSHAR